MAELINIITKKPGWEKKITKPDIVKKWKNELKSQGVNEKFLNIVIELLNEYKTKKSKEYDQEDKYNWTINLGVDPIDLKIECGYNCDKCDCDICQDNLYPGESDSDSDSENDNSNADNYDKKVKKIVDKALMVCKCKDLLEPKKAEFLNIFTRTMQDNIKKSLRYVLKTYVKKFENDKPLDYHPNSNNQIIDIVHPSLYCYVKGVSVVPPMVDINDIPDGLTQSLFQWLPAEFAVKRDTENNIKTSIVSYINNLPHNGNEELYDTIEQIFSNFVDPFESVMKTLYDTGRIKTYKNLEHCQVIVKLATLITTPEKPTHPGGSWHLEGLPNEKIIATGIYYYEMNNVSDTFLNFRSTISDQYIEYPQNGDEYVKIHYGMSAMVDNKDNNMETYMNLGKIQTKENMCIVFPNFLQHQVSGFESIDKTKPGERKILVFFLIDPSSPILSTKHIAPQQSTMTLEDANTYRELLMFQRKFEISNQNSFYERGWSLCEH